MHHACKSWTDVSAALSESGTFKNIQVHRLTVGGRLESSSQGNQALKLGPGNVISHGTKSDSDFEMERLPWMTRMGSE